MEQVLEHLIGPLFTFDAFIINFASKSPSLDSGLVDFRDFQADVSHGVWYQKYFIGDRSFEITLTISANLRKGFLSHYRISHGDIEIPLKFVILFKLL